MKGNIEMKTKPAPNKKINEISTAAEWKKAIQQSKKTRIIELPISKMTVEICGLDLLERASTGDIPLELVADSIRMSTKMESKLKSGSSWLDSLNTEELKGMLELYDKVTILSVVNPKVTEDGSDGTINVHEISSKDKQVIFIATGEMEEKTKMRSFPRKR